MAASRKRLPNNPVTDAVADCLTHHVGQSETRLAVAVSGGLDSVVLLHVLRELRERFGFTLHAVHVHHGLSPHADDWAEFCARRCAESGVDLEVHRVRIATDDALGIEAAARRERLRIFAGMDADFVLTAHHQDDQAETLLLQLLRGAGPKGLAAMAVQQQPAGWRAHHLRPLLGIPRACLKDYASAQGLTWIEDESNLDPHYRRNALRHQVMPTLAAHFPNSAACLARAATLQAETAGLLDELARIDAQSALEDDHLACAVLATLSDARARNLLRYFIQQHGHAMPSARRLGEALRQLLDARDDARVQVRLGELELHRYRGAAYLVPAAPAPAEPVVWRGETRLFVPGAGQTVSMAHKQGQGLSLARLETGCVTLGVRAGGDSLRLRPGGPRRKLKILLQERGVPPWERDRLPVLRCDGKVWWVARIGCEADALAGPDEPGVVPRAAS